MVLADEILPQNKHSNANLYFMNHCAVNLLSFAGSASLPVHVEKSCCSAHHISQSPVELGQFKIPAKVTHGL
jgi:hypothetical protein